MNNLFVNNQAPAIGIEAPGAPQIANNTIVGNLYGISMTSASPAIIKNNIIVGNSVGLETDNLGGHSFIWQNNLVYGNSTNYSEILDQTGTNGNISVDPLFFDPGDNDYHLCLGSPAVDAGDATGLNLPSTDFEGNPRVIGANVDIGAYEFNPNASLRVNFKGDTVTGPAPLSVQFTSLVTADVTAYLWDFGDGTSSTLADPAHTFGPGTYTVSLGVPGPAGTATITRKNLILSGCTINASTQGEGTISPPGVSSEKPGSSLTYTVTPGPGYRLSALIVDGATVRGPSVYPLTYTFGNIQSDHTITAAFTKYFDYFGVQAGNHFESQDTLDGLVTDDISLDTTTFSRPSYLDMEVDGGSQYKGWYQELPDELLIKQMNSMGYTFTFDSALPYIKAPLTVGRSWTGTSTVTVEGITATATFSATVHAMALVNVPAGHFMAWPITFTLTVSAQGNSSSGVWTEWFAPYIGDVLDKWASPAETSPLTSFKVGGGTVTVPPPVVTGTVPKSGRTGSQATVNGFQFGASQGNSKLMFGSVECNQIISWSDTQIECTVPDTAPLGTGAVTVLTDTWTSNGTVQFTVTIPPQPASLTPSSGKRGSAVQIAGTDFGRAVGKVLLGKVQAVFTRWTDSSITFTVPATIPYGTYTITVVNSQGQSSLAGAFKVVK
jgi:parallel beta-helix repeat protein